MGALAAPKSRPFRRYAPPDTLRECLVVECPGAKPAETALSHACRKIDPSRAVCVQLRAFRRHAELLRHAEELSTGMFDVEGAWNRVKACLGEAVTRFHRQLAS